MKVTHKAQVDVSRGCTLAELVEELGKLMRCFADSKVAFGCSLLAPQGPHDDPQVHEEFWLEVTDG